MKEHKWELDLMVTELEQKNRLLRARNERLEQEALEQAAIQQVWQPIETAPRGPVLVYSPDGIISSVVDGADMARYCADHHQKDDPALVSHWMPLPAAPIDAARIIEYF